MDQPMGGKIALRQLGPLPDLNSVVFVRKQNRAFVTGQGPLGDVGVEGGPPFPARRHLALADRRGRHHASSSAPWSICERAHRTALRWRALRTVDAQVVGCENQG